LKNLLICKSCSTANPLFAYTCKKCNAFLRSKIPNIDFWYIISLLIESPVKAAETIIQSEHKNYITALTLISGFKLTLNFWIIHNAIGLIDTISNKFLTSILFGLVGFYSGLLFISFLASMFSQVVKVQTRFKDFFSIYTYSFLPIVFLFVVITPIQIALFGTYWFTFNPSPFIIKNIPSYVILIIEGIFYVWSIALLISANYAQLRNKSISIIISLMELVILSITIFSGLYLFHLMN